MLSPSPISKKPHTVIAHTLEVVIAHILEVGVEYETLVYIIL